MVVAETARQVLEECGVEPGRFSLEWASAAEAPRFVELVTTFVNKIKGFGPLGSGEGEAPFEIMRERLESGCAALNSTKVRTALGNVAKSLKKSGEYDPDKIREAVAGKVRPAVRKERIAHQLQAILSRGAAAVDDIIARIGAPEEDVRQAVETFVKRGKLQEKDGALALAS